MKTSEAEKNGNKCPKCGARTAADHKNRGFVRHLEHRGDCRHGAYGKTERDEVSPKN